MSSCRLHGYGLVWPPGKKLVNSDQMRWQMILRNGRRSAYILKERERDIFIIIKKTRFTCRTAEPLVCRWVVDRWYAVDWESLPVAACWRECRPWICDSVMLIRPIFQFNLSPMAVGVVRKNRSMSMSDPLGFPVFPTLSFLPCTHPTVLYNNTDCPLIGITLVFDVRATQFMLSDDTFPTNRTNRWSLRVELRPSLKKCVLIIVQTNQTVMTMVIGDWWLYIVLKIPTYLHFVYVLNYYW